jgi:uncharacterized iron-regulated protein
VIARTLACLLAASLLAACSSVPQKPADPLAGRIFTSVDGTEVKEQEFMDELAKADVIYLGEKHDQPEHHRLQLQVLQSLLDRGLKPAIGLEMLSVEETSTAMIYTQGTAHAPAHKADFTAEDWLRGKLGWTGIGNANWQYYGPILVKAREHKLTVFGADLPQSLRSRISKLGKSGLSPVEAGQIIDTGLDDNNYRQFMYDRFKHAHCGWGSDDYLSRLYDNWLARNDTMAKGILQTLEEADNRPVILVVGGGHTQFNMGVYERVQHQAPDLKQVNIGFVTLAEESVPLDQYLQHSEFEGRDYGWDHQYIWLTNPRLPAAEDPCKAYLESRKAMSAS